MSFWPDEIRCAWCNTRDNSRDGSSHLHGKDGLRYCSERCAAKGPWNVAEPGIPKKPRRRRKSTKEALEKVLAIIDEEASNSYLECASGWRRVEDVIRALIKEYE